MIFIPKYLTFVSVTAVLYVVIMLSMSTECPALGKIISDIMLQANYRKSSIW